MSKSTISSALYEANFNVRDNERLPFFQYWVPFYVQLVSTMAKSSELLPLLDVLPDQSASLWGLIKKVNSQATQFLKRVTPGLKGKPEKQIQDQITLADLISATHQVTYSYLNGASFETDTSVKIGRSR